MKPPYDITNKILDLYGQITESLGICQSLMLVKPEARLRRQNRIKTIQSSLAIEGNTLNDWFDRKEYMDLCIVCLLSSFLHNNLQIEK